MFSFLALMVGLLNFTPSQTALNHAENVSVIVVDKVTDFDYDNDEIKSKWDWENSCSGFILKSFKTTEIVVTAAHCVYDSTDADAKTEEIGIPKYVKFFDGDIGKVGSFFYNHPNDTVILVVHSMRRHESAQTETHFKRSEHFFMLGMPAGNTWSYSEGFSMEGPVENNDDPSNPGLVALGMVGGFNGSSGGAVFNHEGKVVGIAHAMSGGNPTLFYMIDADHINNTIKSFHYLQAQNYKRKNYVKRKSNY
jgi:hypothetical protein